MAISVSSKLINLAKQEGFALSQEEAEQLVRENQGKSAKQLLKILVNRPRQKPELSDDPEIRAKQLARETKIAVFNLAFKYFDQTDFAAFEKDIFAMASGDQVGENLTDQILKGLGPDEFTQRLNELHAENPVVAYWACRMVCFELFLDLEYESKELGLPLTEFCNKAQREEFQRRRYYGQLVTTEEYASMRKRGLRVVEHLIKNPFK